MNCDVLISIALTTYNGEKYLSKQLDSILSQTHKKIEIVICDDGSTDNTINIINDYSQKYTNIKLHLNDVRLGYVKNFEKAIGFCSGDYIALCDQDDIWEAYKLEVQLKELLEVEKDRGTIPIMVHSDLEIIDSKDTVLYDSYLNYRQYYLNKNKDLGHILGPCGVMGNTIFFNKVLKNLIFPFPESLMHHDYWIALVNEVLGIRVTIPKALTKYRIHDTNTSNNNDKLKRNQFKIRCDFYLPYTNLNRGKVIGYFLEKYSVNQEDRRILNFFRKYLDDRVFIGRRVYYAFKYSFLKRNYIYRLKFILRAIMSK